MTAYRGAGGERYRFHRGRYDHLQPPDRAGTDDGCESVGYGRYRFDRRRRNVVAGSCRNDPDARRAGGVEFGFPFARIAPDGGRIFGIGPDRCSGHAGPDTDGRLYGRVVRSRAAGRGRRWNNLPGYDGGQGQTRQ